MQKFKLPALALGTALAMMSPGAALARDHDRDHERHERREHVCFHSPLRFVGRVDVHAGGSVVERGGTGLRL